MNNNQKKRKKSKNKKKNNQKKYHNDPKRASRQNKKKVQKKRKKPQQKKNKSKGKSKANKKLVRVYGKYHCLECDEKWESTSSYQSRDKKESYSQECFECGYGVYPYYIHQLCRKCNDWPCRCEHRVYGYYRCRKCKKGWESSWTFEEYGTGYILYGQQCKRCKVMNDAYKTQELERNKGNIDEKKPHIQELCERCKYKQNPCSGY